MAEWHINTPQRQAAFLAQIAHESNELNRLEENLRYSARRLQEVWPKRFPTAEIADAYAGDPQKLANRVYAGRLGNGDESTGDGWKYRGREVPPNSALKLTARGRSQDRLWSTAA